MHSFAMVDKSTQMTAGWANLVCIKAFAQVDSDSCINCVLGPGTGRLSGQPVCVRVLGLLSTRRCMLGQGLSYFPGHSCSVCFARWHTFPDHRTFHSVLRLCSRHPLVFSLFSPLWMSSGCLGFQLLLRCRWAADVFPGLNPVSTFLPNTPSCCCHFKFNTRSMPTIQLTVPSLCSFPNFAETIPSSFGPWFSHHFLRETSLTSLSRSDPCISLLWYCVLLLCGIVLQLDFYIYLIVAFTRLLAA